jgi:hypothetical protein
MIFGDVCIDCFNLSTPNLVYRTNLEKGQGHSYLKKLSHFLIVFCAEHSGSFRWRNFICNVRVTI